MNLPKKLTSQQKAQEQQHALERQLQRPGQEFASVEAMLRHDVLHTPVPPAVSSRLQNSINQLPRPASPWWRRWFGK